MRFKPRDSFMWFFCWASTQSAPGRDYPCSIAAFTRGELITRVAAVMNEPWKKTYRQGGRAVRCRLTPCHRKDS